MAGKINQKMQLACNNVEIFILKNIAKIANGYQNFTAYFITQKSQPMYNH